MTTQQSWLPNLVAGVSIWKLAVDLNVPGFMDGRLLEPETEGNDSLPSSVTWDLTGLMPLAEARRDHTEAADKAIAEFFACLEQVRAQFDDPESGYHQYRDAFTLPALDSDEDHYFYSPDRKRLYVVNWGASPRTMQQDQTHLFGHDGFEDLQKQIGVAPVAAVVAGVTAGAAMASDGTKDDSAKEKANKNEKKKDEEKKRPDEDERPWWMWALLLLAAIIIVALLLFFLKDCNDTALDDPDAGSDNALTDGGAGGSGGGSANSGGANPSNGAGGDNGGDGAGGGSGKGGGDGAGGSSGKGGGDGAGGGSGEGGGDGAGGSSGEGGGDGSSGSAGGIVGDGDVVIIPVSSGSGGDVVIAPPDLAASGQAHRSHTHPNAKAWRVSSGRQYVDRTVLVGRQYHVVLKRGARFEQIRVQWRDSQGVWHDH